MLCEHVLMCEDSVASRALAVAVGFLVHLAKLAERSNSERLISALYGAALWSRDNFVCSVYRRLSVSRRLP